MPDIQIHEIATTVAKTALGANSVVHVGDPARSADDEDVLTLVTDFASFIKNKDDATTAPGVGNDNTEGYAVGSRWTDVTGDKVYFALDVTTGAAVWQEVGAGGSVSLSAYQLWTAAQVNPEKEITFHASTMTWDTRDAQNAFITMTASVTDFTVTPFIGKGGVCSLRLINSDGGAKTFAWGGEISWIGDAPTIPTGVGEWIWIPFWSDGSAALYGSAPLSIGTNVQAWSAKLDAIAALAAAAGSKIVGNGSTWAVRGAYDDILHNQVFS